MGARYSAVNNIVPALMELTLVLITHLALFWDLKEHIASRLSICSWEFTKKLDVIVEPAEVENLVSIFLSIYYV